MSPRRTTWPANVMRTLPWTAGQAWAKTSACAFGILTLYGCGGVQARRSSGLRSMSCRSETPAARASTPSRVAEGMVTCSYSSQRCGSISSARNPNASGCFVMIAAAISFGT